MTRVRTMPALLLTGAVALILGRSTRVVLPLVAVLVITFTTVGWGFFIGTEKVMRVLAVELALFAVLTPSWYLDRSPFRPGAATTLPAANTTLNRALFDAIEVIWTSTPSVFRMTLLSVRSVPI